MSRYFCSLPDGWTETRIGRVATVRARIGWKALTASEYTTDGYAFLSTPNIKGREIDYENVNYISEFRYDESPELRIANGDVLLAKDGNTLGIVNLVRSLPFPATVNSSIAVLRPRTIHPEFLRYALETSGVQQEIDRLRSGMGVPHLFQWDINRLEIPHPPIGQQRLITTFLNGELSRFDKLLHARLRQKSLLRESLKNRAAILTGRAPHVEENPKSVPNRVALRRGITSMQTGHTPDGLQSEEVACRDPENYLPWYTPLFLGEAMELGRTDRFVHRSRLNEIPRFSAESILIVGVGESLGKVAYLTHAATGNQQLTAIDPAPGTSGRFLTWQLWAAHSELRQWSQYSRVRLINNDALKAFPVSLPTLTDQHCIAAELDERKRSVDSICQRLDKFTQKMHERRKTLITAAVTGQFDVSAASGRGVTE